MSIEDAIAAAVQAHVSPLVVEIQRLSAQVGELRRALPARLVTLAEAAEQLGVSLATVRRRVRDGSLVSKKLGRAVRIDLSSSASSPATEVDGRVLDIRTTLAARRERASGQT